MPFSFWYRGFSWVRRRWPGGWAGTRPRYRPPRRWSARLQISGALELADPGEDVVERDADRHGFGDHRVEDLGEEPLAPVAAQPVPAFGADERADAPPLVEQPVLGEVAVGARDGGRVDPVERPVLAGRHHLLVRLEHALQDVVPDLLDDLPVDRTTVVEHLSPRRKGQLPRQCTVALTELDEPPDRYPTLPRAVCGTAPADRARVPDEEPGAVPVQGQPAHVSPGVPARQGLARREVHHVQVGAAAEVQALAVRRNRRVGDAGAGRYRQD